MKCLKLTTALCAFAASHAFAFGTLEEAETMAAEMISIINTDGVDGAISAMHDPAKPFSASVMGIHVFEDTIIVADNREPELIATSYADVQDLTGEAMWPRISAAADTKSEAVLEWYHYDTEAEYTYNCYSERAANEAVVVMICR